MPPYLIFMRKDGEGTFMPGLVGTATEGPSVDSKISIASLSDTKKVVAYTTSPGRAISLVVVEVSGDTVTWGTPTQIVSDNGDTIGELSIAAVDSGRIIVGFRRSFVLQQAAVYNVSGFSIFGGSFVTISTLLGGQDLSFVKIDTDKIFAQYTYSVNQNPRNAARILTISGTGITVGAENRFDVDRGGFPQYTHESSHYNKSLIALSPTSVMWSGSTGNAPQGALFSISGDVITHEDSADYGGAGSGFLDHAFGHVHSSPQEQMMLVYQRSNVVYGVTTLRIGSVISHGSAFTIDSTNISDSNNVYNSLKLSDDNMLVTFRDNASNVHLRKITYSGSVPTVGDRLSYNISSDNYHIDRVSSQQVLQLYRFSGKLYGQLLNVS